MSGTTRRRWLGRVLCAGLAMAGPGVVGTAIPGPGQASARAAAPSAPRRRPPSSAPARCWCSAAAANSAPRSCGGWWAGHRVTVFARPNADRSRLQGLRLDYVTGDLLEPGDVAAAFRSRRFAVVVNAVRVEDDDLHFYEKIMRPIAAQAKATRVGHVIHHGAVGAGPNAAKFTTLGWDKVPGLLPRLADQGVGEGLLRDSGVPYTIIRNARLYPDEHPATGAAELTEDDTVLTPMTRADLAILTVRCVANPACFGKTYHVKDASLRWPPASAAAR